MLRLFGVLLRFARPFLPSPYLHRFRDTYTVAMMMKRACCVFLLVFACGASLSEANGVRCTDQAFGNSCPDSAPVCCIINDYTMVGCCPMGTECDKDTGGCQPAPSLPSNATAEPLHDMTVAFHLTTKQLIAVCFLVMGVGLFAFGFLFGLYWLRTLLIDRIEKHRLLARQRELEPSDDDTVTSDEEKVFLSGVAALRLESTVTPRQLLCTVCKSRAVDCVLLDCDHNCVCSGCSSHLKRCPQCKAIIKRRKKIFFV